MNPMFSKSPDERRAMVAKGVATRKRNREAREATRRAEQVEVTELRGQITHLARKLDRLRTLEALSLTSMAMTGNSLLRDEQIVASAKRTGTATGVYFLVKGETVVYVGQAVNVYARIGQHEKEKDFDAVAYAPCSAEHLDVIESLYIHLLQPRMNSVCHAPLKLSEILHLEKEHTQ